MQENLKKILKTDKTNFIKGYCSIAFTDILINQNGEIFCCGCEGWVKKSVGNILDCNSLEEFQKLLDINSDFKKSILNKSYVFCNGYKCFFIQKNLNDEIFFPFIPSIESVKKLKLKKIFLQIDESCNLECPSCRTKKILHKNNYQTKKTNIILDKLNNFILPYYNDVVIRLVGNGELFASHSILPWLLNFDFKKYPQVKFFFHTNGTLLYKHEHFLNDIIYNLKGLEVSVDAATENTYSQIRKGGNWKQLQQGIRIIEKISQKNEEVSISLSFVVSSLNYNEMEEFIKFAKTSNSKPIFYKILQWSMKKDEFDAINIFSPSHKNYQDFKNVLHKLKNYEYETNFTYFFNDL